MKKAISLTLVIAVVAVATQIASAQSYKVTETQPLQRWNEPRMIYELHFENPTEIAKVQFSADGAVLDHSVTTKAIATKDAPDVLPKFTHPLDITNAYLPLASLKQDILVGKEGKKALRVERTAKPEMHKTFDIGDQTVSALVVEDRDFEDGKLVEATLDYFAQSDDGAVYYLGEDVDEYKDGKVVGHSGAWLLGKDTQKPGLLMPAHPKVGDKFRSEDVPRITTEDDVVVSISERITVPAGTFRNCVKVKEVLSDGGVEYKFYAPGIGCVREDPEGGNLQLISHLAKQ